MASQGVKRSKSTMKIFGNCLVKNEADMIVETLVQKSLRAPEATGHRALVVAGGVERKLHLHYLLYSFRLLMLSCNNTSSQPLSAKLASQPRVLQRLKRWHRPGQALLRFFAALATSISFCY